MTETHYHDALKLTKFYNDQANLLRQRNARAMARLEVKWRNDLALLGTAYRQLHTDDVVPTTYAPARR